MSNTIKNLEKGLYEFVNYFKVSDVTDVADPEVKRIVPFRGAISVSGDLIEANYINKLAQAGVWWMVTTKDTSVSAYEKFTTDIVIEQTLEDGFKFKTEFPSSNSNSDVRVVLGSLEYPVKKIVNGNVVSLALGDITAGAIANLTFVNNILILEGENLATKSVPGIITEQRVKELADNVTDTTLNTWCPFPVGSIFISVSNINPGTFWTGTTWQAFATGKTIVGIDTSDTDFNSVNKTGGSKNVALTVNQLPVHSHTVGDNTHNHSINGVGDHSHTLNDHNHYIPPHQHVSPWGDDGGRAPWGTYGGKNMWGSGHADTNNWWYYTSPVDQYTNGAGGVGTSGSGSHSHSMNAVTHNHGLSNTGNNETHNNLQPYIVTYMWQRIS